MSETFISTAFDDASHIAQEILSGLADRSQGALGILFCDSRVAYGAVASAVSAALSFPVTGGTALGFPFAAPDGSEISAALLVIRKQGMKAALRISEPLAQEKHEEQMRRVFDDCRMDLGCDPALVLPFFPLMPGVLTALFIDDIFSLANGVPVFGGTTTNDLVSTKAAVFASDRAYEDRMALVMLGGDIRPVFATSNQVSPMVEYAPVVNESGGYEVLRVDDVSFCEYMRGIGISPEERINGVDALMQYGPTPALMQRTPRQDSDVPEVRCISFTNLSRGSATFSGPVPPGTRLKMSILHKEDVAASTRDCLEKLKLRMARHESDGYTYDAFLCVSCVARYFVLVGGENTERLILRENMPPGLAPLGFYAFCEIGPAYAFEDGTLLNRSHSASIAACAI